MNILSNHPLFTHLTREDSIKIGNLFEKKTIKRNQKIELKNSEKFNILLNGVLQPEGVLNKGENLYVTERSIFGDVPFSSEENRGTLKALTDLEVYQADSGLLSKMLLSSFPALRGYLRLMEMNGMGISEKINPVAGKNSLIVNVVSRMRGDKSAYFAALLSRVFSDSGSTVLVELSRAGVSVFDVCGLKITPPISEKKIGSDAEINLKKFIVEKTANFHLLNISFGSKVKTDPSIISPLISYLSGMYSNIVVYSGFQAADVIHEAAYVSDKVIFFNSSLKQYEKSRDGYDDIAFHGQKVFSVYAESRTKEVKKKGRVFALPQITDNEADINSLYEWSQSRGFSAVSNELLRHDKLIFLQNTGFSSLGFAGLIDYLDKNDSGFSIYAPSYALNLAALLNMNEKLYKRSVKRFFKDLAVLSLFDVCYPNEYLLSNKKIVSLVSNYGKKLFMEESRIDVYTAFCDNMSEKVISCGSFRDIGAAVLCESPFFKSYRAGDSLLSALPGLLHPSYFLSRHFSEIITMTISSEKPVYPNASSHYLFKAGLGADLSRHGKKWMSAKNIVIDVQTIKYNIKGIIDSLSKRWDGIVKPLA